MSEPKRRTSDLFALRAPLRRRPPSPSGSSRRSLVLGAWCVASYGGLAPPDFLPSPTEVVRGTLQLFLQYDLWGAILVSTRRIALSFLLASAVALPLGVLMGAFEPVNRIFEPIVAPLRYMPISAFIPLLILWFGIYEKQKIAFLFLGVFVYLLPVVVTAIRAVPEELVQTALTLGASRTQVIRTVLLPAAAPEIFDSFRVMNAISWTYVILAEAVNPEHGLGYMVELARTHQKASWSFAGLLVIGGIGLLTDFVIRSVSRVAFRWREAGVNVRRAEAGAAAGRAGDRRGRRRARREEPSYRADLKGAAPKLRVKDLSITYVGRDGDGPRRCATSRWTSTTSRASARSSSSSARRAAASRRS